jgi:hypothetical protein
MGRRARRFNAGSASLMVLVGEVEPALSDPYDELADADVISSGGEDFGTLAASRGVRFVRSRRARIIGACVLAGAVSATALLVTASPPTSGLGPPGQQMVMTSTAVRAAGVAGPGGWVGPTGCRRARSCPRG